MNEPYHLPQALVRTSPEPGASRQEVYILNYTSTATSRKSKITLHYHLFSFLTEGEKRVVYPAATVGIQATQFLLLATGNCLMSEKRVGPTGAYRSTMLFFSDQALAAFFQKYPALAAPAPAPPRTPFVVFETDEFLRHFVHSLNLLVAAGSGFTAALQALKLEELLLYLCQHYPQQVPALRATVAAPEPAEHLALRQVVAAHCHTAVTVEDLAFLCHTSVSTFKRRFGRLYGTSPSKWLVQQRLAVAASLLQQGHLKTSDVYYQVGYENLSSFIQSFKQEYGLTPKQYQGQKLNA